MPLFPDDSAIMPALAGRRNHRLQSRGVYEALFEEEAICVFLVTATRDLAKICGDTSYALARYRLRSEDVSKIKCLRKIRQS